MAALNNGQVSVDRARFAIRDRQKTRDVIESIPRRSVSYTPSTSYMNASFPSPPAATS